MEAGEINYVSETLSKIVYMEMQEKMANNTMDLIMSLSRSIAENRLAFMKKYVHMRERVENLEPTPTRYLEAMDTIFKLHFENMDANYQLYIENIEKLHNRFVHLANEITMCRTWRREF